MKRLLSILFCIAFVFCLVSCDSEDSTESAESNSTTIEPTASFNTVEDFVISLKKNPKLYIDKYVAVKGYANASTLQSKRVWLYDELLKDNELYDGRARIKVDITDSVLLAVIEDGDYIEIYGIVEILEGEVCLGNCTYTMIATNEEQQK